MSLSDSLLKIESVNEGRPEAGEATGFSCSGLLQGGAYRVDVGITIETRVRGTYEGEVSRESCASRIVGA